MNAKAPRLRGIVSSWHVSRRRISALLICNTATRLNLLCHRLSVEVHRLSHVKPIQDSRIRTISGRDLMKLIVVTPAGREKYLRLLSHHVLKSPEVYEWHLWDNCRNEADRAYLQRLAASDPRCRIKKLPHADGGINVIGDFFRFCDDPDAFYLRLDDDVVFVEDGFFQKFMARVMAERDRLSGTRR